MFKEIDERLKKLENIVMPSVNGGHRYEVNISGDVYPADKIDARPDGSLIWWCEDSGVKAKYVFINGNIIIADFKEHEDE